MNSRDPIEVLESYYRDLKDTAIPALCPIKRTVRWWEAAGGLAAGVAAVVIAVSICLNISTGSSAPSNALTEHQLRMAGLRMDALPPHRRVQGGQRWLA